MIKLLNVGGHLAILIKLELWENQKLQRLNKFKNEHEKERMRVVKINKNSWKHK